MVHAVPEAHRTIVALSSGSLPSGVAVLRLSGPAAFGLAEILAGPLPAPRTLALRRFVDPRSGEALDQGLLAIFPSPHSFTGEDCVEFQAHGSPAGVRALLDALLATGRCALAEAGDFTRRAFENGKLDLTAVEGLGDLLAAETEAQRRQALARLDGALAKRAMAWRDTLLGLRAELEAHLDFSDEDDVPPELSGAYRSAHQHLCDDLSAALAGYEHGRLVREGFRVVLYGAPNAGKSSLLNALAGTELAIVTTEAGTTRDLKEVAIDLGGLKLVLVDTAGLRATDSLAEAAGIALTTRAAGDADLVLWLQAPDTTEVDPPTTQAPVWIVRTKSDLTPNALTKPQGLAVTTRDPGGISPLIGALQHHIEEAQGREPALISYTRDRLALETAHGHLSAAAETDKPLELVGEDLRLAGQALARLMGLIDSEHVLDRLFAGFCIGK